MPFTLFHPALVLPGCYLPGKWKKQVSITGLITGSVAPDFEKFIQMRGGNTYSHTLAGVFGLDLPTSILLAVIFHLVIKNTLIDYLPGSALSARFSAYQNQNWMVYAQHRYGIVLISMLIGIFSHLLLDSATHANGELVHILPILSSYYEFSFLSVKGYQLLEICYYLLSTAAISWALVVLPKQNVRNLARTRKVFFWSGLIGLTFLVIYLRLLVNPTIRHIWDLASLATAAGLISLLLSCLIWRRIA